MMDQVTTSSKIKRTVPLLLLTGLLLLRFPILIIPVRFNVLISSDTATSLYVNGTYLLTALLIFVKRDSLSDYHIDFYALVIFLLAPAAKLWGESLWIDPETALSDSWFQCAVSAALLVALLICRPKLRRAPLKKVLLWFVVAVAAGLLTAIMLSPLALLQVSGKSHSRATLPWLIQLFGFQLGYAAASEEPLFRGFLWGFLRRAHWKEFWIWLFQAALFMLGHIYYLGINNYSFWIIVPVSALILGLLAWRSRSIGTSMIAHGLINSFGTMLMRILS